MRIKTGQRIYKVRSVDGRWLKKTAYPNVEWTESEAEAHIFRKLHHLVQDLRKGVLVPEKLEVLLDGLPPEALQIVEFEITVYQTGRKHRLTEILKFYSEEQPKKKAGTIVTTDV